jgi:hypothetical protein
VPYSLTLVAFIASLRLAAQAMKQALLFFATYLGSA